MIKIIILNKLRDEIYKTFKKESSEVYKLIYSLKENPNKGKTLGVVENIKIKELKYKTYRFYFIFNGPKLILFNQNQINEILFRFVRMSKKNNQQKTIDRIKEILEKIGLSGFEK